MSIRLIAQDLYRLWREVVALEKQVAAADGEQRRALAEQLRLRRAEYQRLREALDGQKDAAANRGTAAR